MRSRRGAPLVLAVVLAVGGVACSTPQRLDVTVIERALPAQLVADHPEVVTDVACPRPIARRVGLVVSCTAALGGAPVTVTVTQLDANGAVRAAQFLDLADALSDETDLSVWQRVLGALDGITRALPPGHEHALDARLHALLADAATACPTSPTRFPGTLTAMAR